MQEPSGANPSAVLCREREPLPHLPLSGIPAFPGDRDRVIGWRQEMHTFRYIELSWVLNREHSKAW